MKSRFVNRIQVALLLVFGAFPAHGYNVYSLGGTEGNPWPAGVSSQPGEYLILGPTGRVEGRRTLTTPSTYPTWSETLTVWVDSGTLSPPPVRGSSCSSR